MPRWISVDSVVAVQKDTPRVWHESILDVSYSRSSCKISNDLVSTFR